MGRWTCGGLGLIAVLVLAVSGCARPTPAGPVGDTAAAQKLRKELLRGAPAGAEEEVVEEPTGFATLRGRFVIDGTPPAPRQLAVNADADVCAPAGMAVYDQSVVVGPDGGIANVVIYARKVPAEFAHPDAAPGKTDQVDFDQKNCEFQTHVLAVQTSQPVNVMNSDPVGHNTNIPDAGFNQTVPAKDALLFRPNREATFPLRTTCSIHPWMLAYILPRNDSYVAVTKSDGAFEIPNLPAGITLEFQVWQEKAGNVSAVKVNGEDTVWKSGRFKLKLEPDSPTELAVNVPAAAFQ